MKKRFFLPLLLVYTTTCFLVSALLILLFYRLIPNKQIFLFPSVAGFSLIFGILSFFPLYGWIQKKTN